MSNFENDSKYKDEQDQIFALKEENERLRESLAEAIDIKPPINFSNEDSPEEANFQILIKEMNICFKNKAYTAVALLSRKIIMNLSHVLSKNENIEFEVIEYECHKTGEKRDFTNDKVAKNFEYFIEWLFKHNFLTKNDRKILHNLREETNFLNHEIDINNTEEEASRFFSTIRHLIESNFETKKQGWRNRRTNNKKVSLNNEVNEEKKSPEFNEILIGDNTVEATLPEQVNLDNNE